MKTDNEKVDNAVIKAMIIGRETLSDIKLKIKKESDGKVEKAEGDPAQGIRIFESFAADYSGGEVIQPPYDLEILSMLPELSSMLPQCIDAMKQNIEGFGYDLIPRIKVKDKEALLKRIEEETEKIDEFIEDINFNIDLETLRKQLRQDYEALGNSYVEIIRNIKEEIAGLEYVQGVTMRLTTMDKDYTEYDALKVDRKTNKIEKVKREKRFRRYVQFKDEKTVFFKEINDPRDINRETGMVVTEEDSEQAKTSDKEIKFATEMYHFRQHSSRSDYGIPRWIGSTVAILGNRATEEVNYDYFDNKAIPPLAILVSGGSFAKNTVDDIKNYVEENIKGRKNFHKILILEAMPVKGSLTDPSKPVKIEIKELGQISEARFLAYLKDNDNRVRSSFRLPPIFVGLSEDYSKATAKESRLIAEPQVFLPERRVFDNFMNKFIFPAIGITLLKFRSKAAPYNQAEEWSEILETFSKTGLTAREIRKIINTITEVELEDYETKEENKRWLDIPLPLAIKEAGQSSVVKMITEGKEGKQVDKDDITELALKILHLREVLAGMYRDSKEVDNE